MKQLPLMHSYVIFIVACSPLEWCGLICPMWITALVMIMWRHSSGLMESIMKFHVLTPGSRSHPVPSMHIRCKTIFNGRVNFFSNFPRSNTNSSNCVQQQFCSRTAASPIKCVLDKSIQKQLPFFCNCLLLSTLTPFLFAAFSSWIINTVWVTDLREHTNDFFCHCSWTFLMNITKHWFTLHFSLMSLICFNEGFSINSLPGNVYCFQYFFLIFLGSLLLFFLTSTCSWLFDAL